MNGRNETTPIESKTELAALEEPLGEVQVNSGGLGGWSNLAEPQPALWSWGSEGIGEAHTGAATKTSAGGGKPGTAETPQH